MAATLPDLCFEEIFSYFKYDYSTLFSCLLTNRVWCRNAVPYLWKCPFRKSLTTLNAYHLIRTYLSCLNNVELSILNSHGLYINDKNAIFEYGRYAEELPFKYLNDAIRSWMKLKVDFWKYEKLLQPISTVICHMLMRQEANIKNVGIELDRENFPELGAFSEYQNCLSRVRNLELYMDRYCTFTRSQSFLGFLFQIATSCSNISRLIINSNNNSNFHSLSPDVIAGIILSQKNIEELSLNGIITPTIIYALQRQVHSLKILKFENVKFKGISFTWLNRCKKLETIAFIRCNGMLLDSGLSYLTTNIKNLEILDDKESFTSSSVIEVFHSIGENLMTLKLNIIDNNIMNVISMCCLNLEFIDVEVPDEMYTVVRRWIETLPVKSFDLHSDDDDDKYIIDESEIGEADVNKIDESDEFEEFDGFDDKFDNE
ncbi:hypothetical protein Glove_340g67 [Diversispora epigaea]|uniref:F-box domain-containing protein n=1 Tax=Diversispora epigaea TaxID=1348612 RepID=A0A397HGY9_9GLOM|nr:hypothetical protein Glove_340g67 [Diversispora epigaea]